MEVSEALVIGAGENGSPAANAEHLQASRLRRSSLPCGRCSWQPAPLSAMGETPRHPYSQAGRSCQQDQAPNQVSAHNEARDGEAQHADPEIPRQEAP